MELNIVDFRNRRLDAALCDSSANDLIVSSMLSATEPALPASIKQVLDLYFVRLDAPLDTINITVEVNEWVNEETARLIVKHTNRQVIEYLQACGGEVPEIKLALHLDGKQIPMESPILEPELS